MWQHRGAECFLVPSLAPGLQLGEQPGAINREAAAACAYGPHAAYFRGRVFLCHLLR